MNLPSTSNEACDDIGAAFTKIKFYLYFELTLAYFTDQKITEQSVNKTILLSCPLCPSGPAGLLSYIPLRPLASPRIQEDIF